MEYYLYFNNFIMAVVALLTQHKVKMTFDVYRAAIVKGLTSWDNHEDGGSASQETLATFYHNIRRHIEDDSTPDI
jgi:hypothetical protein